MPPKLRVSRGVPEMVTFLLKTTVKFKSSPSPYVLEEGSVTDVISAGEASTNTLVVTGGVNVRVEA